MANKFTQSVLERQFQEKKAQRRTAQAVDAPEAAPVPAEPPHTPPQDHSPEAPAPARPSLIGNDITAYLDRSPQRVAKNKTFYLDEAVIAAVKETAKKQKVTESKLVNDILKKVLLRG